MTASRVWLIRNDVFDNDLELGGFVSVGWDHVPDLSTLSELSTTGLSPYLLTKDPQASTQRLAAYAGVLRRFHDEIEAGDVVVAPRRGTKLLRVGTVTGEYFYTADEPVHRHRCPVTWAVTDLERDSLPEEVRAGLRNISTLSQVRREPGFFVNLTR